MLEEAVVLVEHFRKRTVEQVNDVFARQLADQILHCLYDTAKERICARMLVELPAATHLMPQGDVRQCAECRELHAVGRRCWQQHCCV